MNIEMKCQHCPDTFLVLSDMQGIEVDRCPNCCGLWLDCGELDSIVDRSNLGHAQATRRNANANAWAESSDALYTVNAYPTIPRRRKSIFGEFFKFQSFVTRGLRSPWHGKRRVPVGWSVMLLPCHFLASVNCQEPSCSIQSVFRPEGLS